MPECPLRALRKIAATRGNGRNIHRNGSICVEAVLLRHQVQLHQIARLNRPRARNAVHDLVVDADTNVSRVAVHQRRRGSGAVLGERPRSNLVELTRRDARPYPLRHRSEHPAHNAADAPHLLEFSVRLDGHDLILTLRLRVSAVKASPTMLYFPLMKIAVIGLGFMGSTHLKALRNVPEAELAAVVSKDEQKLSGDLSGIQGNLGGPGEKMDFSHVKKYRHVREAIEDPEIDAVDICLPTDQHAPAAIAALRAGKHVLVEKPMALDGAGADQILAEARKTGRVLMTGQVLRFIGAYRNTAERVKSGSLGAVRSALFRRRCAAPAWSQWLADPARSGGGVFDLLIHDVDYCVHLLGKPAAVSATGYEKLERGIDVIVAEFH